MGRRLLNFTLLVLLGPLLFTFAREGVRFLVSVFTLEATQWFLLGAGLSLVIHLLLLQDSIRFLEILMHELEHAVLPFLLTFRLPTKMEINTEGKSTVQVPAGGGCLMTLAPYYLPLLTIPLLLVKALAALVFSWLDIDFPALLALVLDVLIGATLAFHLVTTVKEFHPRQDDLRKEGLIPSFGIVLFLNLIFVILSIVVVTGSYAELWAYVKAAAAATGGAYLAFYEFVRDRALPALGQLLQWLADQFSGGSTPAPSS